MAIEKELLGHSCLAGRDPNEVFAKDGLLDDLKKALSERILNAELDEHLDGERVEGGTDRRNGHSKKSVLTGTSKMTLSIPRDRAGTFDPKLIAKYQRRFPTSTTRSFRCIARGMSVRQIRGHLEELYGIDVSADLIFGGHRCGPGGGRGMANRPLDVCYPLVFFDAIRVQNRDEGFCPSRTPYIALGIRPDGTQGDTRHLDRADRDKFWLRVMNELKNRGIGDILIAVADGLKGFFPEAINAVFPLTVIQTCIRASDPPLAGVRVLEGPQARCSSAQGDLTEPDAEAGLKVLGSAATHRCP